MFKGLNNFILRKILIKQQLQYISINNNKYINVAGKWSLLLWEKYPDENTFHYIYLFIYRFLNNTVRNAKFITANCCKIVNNELEMMPIEPKELSLNLSRWTKENHEKPL